MANRPWSFWAQKIGGFHRLLFGYSLGKAAAAVAIDPEVPWFGVIGTDWTGTFPSISMNFLGVETWCLDFQILLMVSTIVLVVGKPGMVQLIRSASQSV